MSCPQLSDEGTQFLAGFTAVRNLSLGGSPITGKALAAVVRGPRLNRIDLSRCSKLQDADFAALGEAYNLNSVQLESTAAGDLAADALARLNNLNSVQLGSPQLTDVGMRKLCSTVSLRSLAVTREADQVTDEGLANLWLLSNLEHLTLATPRITRFGLAPLRELHKLRQLSLPGLGVTDAACEHIARSESLRQVSLGSWQGGLPGLTDAGLQRPAASPSLQQLEVHRKGTQVTDAGVAELKKSQPQWKIQAHGP